MITLLRHASGRFPNPPVASKISVPKGTVTKTVSEWPVDPTATT
jgi:hypothetical protein